MSGGLLIAGKIVPVPGLTIFNPRDTAWSYLAPGDYKPRTTKWVRQLIVHSTKGKWPQPKRSGAGPVGAARNVADYWHRDPQHSAAHIVVDRDGSVACLADLAFIHAYHATKSNDLSVGIELYQNDDGSIYEAIYDAVVKLVPALCDALSIPFQITSDIYVPGKIISRMLHGGPDCVGIFGHRDQAWMFPEWIGDPAKRRDYPNGYASRGRGDPGDEIYKRLIAAGAEPFRYAELADLSTWKRRQRAINERHGTTLTTDGICGPSTMRAMRQFGYDNGLAIAA